MKTKIERLFQDLRLAQVEVLEGEGKGATLLFLESMTQDVLAITVSIPSEHINLYVTPDDEDLLPDPNE